MELLILALLYNRTLVYALETIVNWDHPLAKEKGLACSQPLVYRHLPLLAYVFERGGEEARTNRVVSIKLISPLDTDHDWSEAYRKNI
jgi:hypothetical protein